MNENKLEKNKKEILEVKTDRKENDNLKSKLEQENLVLKKKLEQNEVEKLIAENNRLKKELEPKNEKGQWVENDEDEEVEDKFDYTVEALREGDK